jgi:CheY-like chemotaxis protein
VLINDILDFSKIESSDVKIEKIEFSLSQVIDSAVEILAPKAEHKKLDFFSQVKVGLPSTLIGDPHRLRQILINLLSNAVKFTDKGEVILKVEQHPTNSTPGALLFSVIDTGIGIPKDKTNILFERFTQADTSVTRKYGGTGLGLSISKKLVELMGGQISLESAEGKGSIFKFAIVFATCNPTGLTKPNSRELKNLKAEEKVEITEDKKPLSILLVDDFEDNRVLINLYLKNTPYVIEMAENGQIAVEKFTTGNFDIILMDMQMPVMDGYTATKKIREIENQKGVEKAIPIIGLTAYALHEDEGKSLEAGCNIHMIKPVKKIKLLDAITNLTK